MQSLKDKLIRRTIQYKNEKCNVSGWLKVKNVDKKVVDGLKEVGDKIEIK